MRRPSCRSIIGNMWSRFFFKKRKIFSYKNQSHQSDIVDYFDLSQQNQMALEGCVDPQLMEFLVKRGGKASWVLFVVRKDHEVLGYAFLHVPQRTEWLDSLPTLAGEARCCSVFVFPHNRGKGFAEELVKAQVDYSYRCGKRMWSVVEKSNLPSLRVMEKVGVISGYNFLIKILGVNVMSIQTPPLQIWFLGRVRRGHI